MSSTAFNLLPMVIHSQILSRWGGEAINSRAMGSTGLTARSPLPRSLFIHQIRHASPSRPVKGQAPRLSRAVFKAGRVLGSACEPHHPASPTPVTVPVGVAGQAAPTRSAARKAWAFQVSKPDGSPTGG